MTLDDLLPRSAAESGGAEPHKDTLDELSAEASYALQQIQNRIGRSHIPEAKVRFPRGYLREARLWRSTVSFLASTDLQKNIAYTLMLYDVQAWVLRRTDLEGQPREMLVKGAIAFLASVAEALLVAATSPPLGRRQMIASRIQHLLAETKIDEHLSGELLWLWGVRNRQHLYELDAPEFDVYSRADHPRAEAAVAHLIKVLQA